MVALVAGKASIASVQAPRCMLSKPIPSKLYKYRRFDVFCLRALTHAEVVYSDPRSFNDPLDCHPTIEVDLDRGAMEHLCCRMMLRTQSVEKAKAEIDHYRYLSSEHGDFREQPAVEDYLKRILAQRIQDELRQEFGSQGVLSLSERWNSVLMWSHYADDHRGVCIEFDTTDIGHSNLKPVNYRASRRIRASELLKWKRDKSVEAERHVFDTYFFAKAGPWRHEKEWRAIEVKNGPREASFRVTAIYFGLQCDAAVIQSVVKLLDRDLDVGLYDMVPLDDSFRLRRRPVNRDEIRSYGLRIPAAIEFKDVFLTGEVADVRESE
jgi:hypothetical protein